MDENNLRRGRPRGSKTSLSPLQWCITLAGAALGAGVFVAKDDSETGAVGGEDRHRRGRGLRPGLLDHRGGPVERQPPRHMTERRPGRRITGQLTLPPDGPPAHTLRYRPVSRAGRRGRHFTNFPLLRATLDALLANRLPDMELLTAGGRGMPMPAANSAAERGLVVTPLVPDFRRFPAVDVVHQASAPEPRPPLPRSSSLPPAAVSARRRESRRTFGRARRSGEDS